jgi:hypothetical protein
LLQDSALGWIWEGWGLAIGRGGCFTSYMGPWIWVIWRDRLARKSTNWVNKQQQRRATRNTP